MQRNIKKFRCIFLIKIAFPVYKSDHSGYFVSSIRYFSVRDTILSHAFKIMFPLQCFLFSSVFDFDFKDVLYMPPYDFLLKYRPRPILCILNRACSFAVMYVGSPEIKYAVI